MKHTVCFIDDKIPVAQYGDFFNDTDIISSSVIKYLLKQENTDWTGDWVVKAMCEKLINEPEKWTVSAFTSPNFYDNYTKDTVYAPDIVIYDWDYNFGSDESEKHLLEILESSYTMIFVFSGSDHIEEIKEIVSKEVFKRFGDRLNVVDKNEENSIDSIFLQIEKKEQGNFSFAYGFEVVRNSNKAIHRVLSDISLLSIGDFLASIGARTEGNKYISSNEDFIDAIIPRYKSVMCHSVVTSKIEKEKSDSPNLDYIRNVWSYRLFDKNSNNNVQMGDIIKNSNNEYYLVLSSDCHLTDFWKKNFGYISLVPLFPTSMKEIQERIKLRKDVKDNLTSLTNFKHVPFTILPCVPTQENQLEDFIVITKSITSVEIKKTEGDDKALIYSNFADFEKVASISDPFKSPLIQFIFDNISGYGCPDFPASMQEDLKNKIKEILS